MSKQTRQVSRERWKKLRTLQLTSSWFYTQSGHSIILQH